MKKVIAILLLINFWTGYSQNKSETDIANSLQIIATTTNDSVKSTEYSKLSEKYNQLRKPDLQKKYADSASKYAEKLQNPSLLIESMVAQINVAIIKKDTASASKLFTQGFSLIKQQNISPLNDALLKFKIKHITYLKRLKRYRSDSVLAAFKAILKDIKPTNKYYLVTDVLGRISLTYRNRKELGKALNYNKQEIEFANKSKDPYQIASSKITELDLSYQLIPKPIQAEDVRPLIKKAKIAEEFMQQHDILNILMFTKLYLAKFYIHETNYAKSEETLLKVSDSLETRIVFSKYEQLCEIAKSTNDLEKYRFYTLKFKPLAYETKREFVALNVHNYLLDYSIKNKSKDSAQYYAQKLETNLSKVDTTQFLDYVYFSYDVLSRHYATTPEKDKSIQYQGYANNINRQIIANQKEAFLNIVKYREEVENLQDKNTNLNDSMSFLRNNFLLLSVLSIGLLALLIFVFRKYKTSAKEKIKVEEEKKQIEKIVERKSILLNNKQKLYLDEITHIKSDRNYVEVHTIEKTVVDRNTLVEIAKQLPPNFIKTHRSYLVNKNFIKSIGSNSLIITTNVEIPISRTFKKNVV